eukprot:m.185646 g.185646  ORF g.185646 m.185646 type:complete len:206 (+) comp14734_c0_seq1:605-1222(+)
MPVRGHEVHCTSKRNCYQQQAAHHPMPLFCEVAQTAEEKSYLMRRCRTLSLRKAILQEQISSKLQFVLGACPQKALCPFVDDDRVNDNPFFDPAVQPVSLDDIEDIEDQDTEVDVEVFTSDEAPELSQSLSDIMTLHNQHPAHPRATTPPPRAKRTMPTPAASGLHHRVNNTKLPKRPSSAPTLRRLPKTPKQRPVSFPSTVVFV